MRLSSDRDSGAGGVATGNLSDSANEGELLNIITKYNHAIL